MRHLNVGQSQERPVAACGAAVRRTPEETHLPPVTTVLQRCDCPGCHAAVDLLLLAGLLEIDTYLAIPIAKTRGMRGRSYVYVHSRAFPFSPPPCPHRHIAARVEYAGMPQVFRSEVRGENIETTWHQPVRTGAFCADCGAGPLPGAMTVAEHLGVGPDPHIPGRGFNATAPQPDRPRSGVRRYRYDADGDPID